MPPARFTRVELPIEPLRALPTLLALNVGVFVLWQIAIASGATGFMESNFLVSGASVRSGRVWTLLTSAFSHNIVPHLAFNMLALWVFGADVERVVGARGFWHLYVVGGILASLGHVAYGLATGTPTPALGASGSVMAVAVVAAMLFPRRLLLLFFVIPMPQFMAVGLFILLDVVGALSPGADMVAHAAHLGGALYGAIYVRWHLRGYLQERLRAVRPDLHGRRARPDIWTHPEQ